MSAWDIGVRGLRDWGLKDEFRKSSIPRDAGWSIAMVTKGSVGEAMAGRGKARYTGGR